MNATQEKIVIRYKLKLEINWDQHKGNELNYRMSFYLIISMQWNLYLQLNEQRETKR